MAPPINLAWQGTAQVTSLYAACDAALRLAGNKVNINHRRGEPLCSSSSLTVQAHPAPGSNSCAAIKAAPPNIRPLLSVLF